jgi:acetoacetyl-CoA synthetase
VTAAARVIWEPDAERIERAEQTRFLRWLRGRGVECEGYADLWRWSIADLPAFWTSVWDFYGLRGSRGDAVLEGTEMPGFRWFAGSELNFAEHLLLGADDALAVIAANEAGEERRVSYGELRELAGAAQATLRGLGVGRGDRVVALLPNTLETLAAFIAVAGLGAIWSSCSPEFGTQAVIDRFAQLEPSVLLAVDAYRYGGKTFDKRADVQQLRAALPTLRHVLRPDDLAGAPAAPAFERLPFEHPLWVLYSSGTTGLPKGIVHGHGGILIESTKQARLQLDVGPADRFFWFTTTGWMMWNVVVSALLSGGTAVLYDGHPGYPDQLALWRLAERAGITYLGVSASFLQLCEKQGVEPGRDCDLSALRSIGSTGSPLAPEGFDWVRRAVGPQVPVFSVSGGTDVCSAFLSSSPLLPVYAGELQCRALGCDVQAWNEHGEAVVGEVGELVVTKPMPSMPISLWNDPDGERYRETYFSMFPGVWRHGDWLTITERGTAILHGRSDATLNRGGIRMGSAEFYRVVEAHPLVADSLVVEGGPDATTARLVLFVVLRDDAELDEELARELKATVRERISPRHVPDEVVQVPEIPRTLNGKKLEVPVKRLLQGVPIDRAASRGSVANPRALEFFERLAVGERPS